MATFRFQKSVISVISSSNVVSFEDVTVMVHVIVRLVRLVAAA